KRIFKRLAERYLPHDIVHRQKHGFGVPVGTWMRGPLREFTRATVLDERGLVLQLMRKDSVVKLVEDHQRGHDRGTRLWALLMLNLWHRRFFTSA
ncbi:MAG TPA: asparagine synthase-related protein, partial [Vicinamibacterales bacterium]